MVSAVILKSLRSNFKVFRLKMKQNFRSYDEESAKKKDVEFFLSPDSGKLHRFTLKSFV